MFKRTRHIRLGTCVISCFRREVDETYALLGYYAAYYGNFLPTFRDTLIPISKVQEIQISDSELVAKYIFIKYTVMKNTISSFHWLLVSAFCSGQHRTMHFSE